jgi:fructokinase
VIPVLVTTGKNENSDDGENSVAFSIGLDVGGTKIAGAVFDDVKEISRSVLPTPKDYADFLSVCVSMIRQLEEVCGAKASVGVGIPGAVAAEPNPLPTIANIPCLSEKNLQRDLQEQLKSPVRLANDADCAALSEATDGAGAGYRSVFGLIMGTGIGGGIVIDGKLVQGANGLTGEIGHLPLPFREPSDGPVVPCSCGQSGCIDKSASGPALLRQHHVRTGKMLKASPEITELARQGDAEAVETLDRFYMTVAKSMVPILHSFDPDIIVVSGGLNNLPGLYEAVPKLWGQYAMIPNPKTLFVPAKHGALSGLRGAARLGRTA